MGVGMGLARRENADRAQDGDPLNYSATPLFVSRSRAYSHLCSCGMIIRAVVMSDKQMCPSYNLPEPSPWQVKP